MKTWTEFCAEPNRHSVIQGREIFRFINEEDYRAIQADAAKQLDERQLDSTAEDQTMVFATGPGKTLSTLPKLKG